MTPSLRATSEVGVAVAVEVERRGAVGRLERREAGARDAVDQAVALQCEERVGLAGAAAREDLLAAVAVEIEHGGAGQVMRRLAIPAVREVHGDLLEARLCELGGEGGRRLRRMDPDAARGGEGEQRERNERASHGGFHGYWRTKVTVPTGTLRPSCTK